MTCPSTAFCSRHHIYSPMQFTRRILTILIYLIGLWVLTSVAGAFLDPAHAEFWSANLMWSFLSSLLVAPALVMIYDASTRAPNRSRSNRSRASKPATSPSDSGPTSSSTPEKPFVKGASAAYPVSNQTNERARSEEDVWPEWVEAQSA